MNFAEVACDYCGGEPEPESVLLDFSEYYPWCFIAAATQRCRHIYRLSTHTNTLHGIQLTQGSNPCWVILNV